MDRRRLGLLTTHGFFDDQDPREPPDDRQRFEAEAEHKLEFSAGLLVGTYFSAMPEEVEVTARVWLTDGPVDPGDGIHVEAVRTDHGFAVVAAGAVDRDWPEAVLGRGVAELDGHFVTRVLEEADDSGRPQVVEALFVVPESNAPDAMPVGRPYVAHVRWEDDEDLREIVPTLSPVLDGYAEELLGEVRAAGDPYGIEGLFPRR